MNYLLSFEADQQLRGIKGVGQFALASDLLDGRQQGNFVRCCHRWTKRCRNMREGGVFVRCWELLPRAMLGVFRRRRKRS